MPTYRITLQGRDVSFDCHEGETILAAARRAGVPMLAGCHHGACRTCAARLKGGRVHLPEGTALTPELLAAHVLLPCVTTVSSDVVLETGPPGAPLDAGIILAWTD